MRRTAEFDAFGPWVDEVHDLDGVPPLYRDHPLDLGAAALVLKVPRRIERRNANPDMNLYDHLVVAGQDALTLLSRRVGADGYTTHEVPYDSIAAVEHSTSLLDGRFVVHDVRTDTLEVAFRYNSVSREVVARLMRVVRERAAPETAAGTAGSAAPTTSGGQLGLHDLGDQDIALVTAQRDLVAHEPNLSLLGVHRRTRVRRITGAMQGVMELVWPITAHAAVVCGRPGELHLIHRREWLSTGRRPVHSVAHTVLVVDRVTDVSVQDTDRFEGVQMVRVTAGASVQTFPIPHGAETGTAIQRALAGT